MARTYKKAVAGAAVLRETMAALGLNARELSEALGMSPTFVKQCLKRGSAPAWAEAACYGLRELARDRTAERKTVIVVQPDPEQADAVRTVLAAMNVSHSEVPISQGGGNA